MMAIARRFSRIPAVPAGEPIARPGGVRTRLRALVVGVVLLAGSMIPAAASAVTLEQVLALKSAGVTDAVVLALIDRGVASAKW